MAPQEIATPSRQPDLLTFNDVVLLKPLHHAMALEFAEVMSVAHAVVGLDRVYKQGIKNRYEINFHQKISVFGRSTLLDSLRVGPPFNIQNEGCGERRGRESGKIKL